MANIEPSKIKEININILISIDEEFSNDGEQLATGNVLVGITDPELKGHPINPYMVASGSDLVPLPSLIGNLPAYIEEGVEAVMKKFSDAAFKAAVEEAKKPRRTSKKTTSTTAKKTTAASSSTTAPSYSRPGLKRYRALTLGRSCVRSTTRLTRLTKALTSHDTSALTSRSTASLPAPRSCCASWRMHRLSYDAGWAAHCCCPSCA